MILQWLSEFLCALAGHRVEQYDSDLYGPLFVCTRCMGEFTRADESEHASRGPPVHGRNWCAV